MKIISHITSDENNQFKQIDYNEIRTNRVDNFVNLKVNTSIKRQEIDGFGASFTDSAAYLIDKCLPENLKNQLMNELFDPVVGIGITAIRNPMGASDYARTIYSYNDLEAGNIDIEQNNFSINHDLESILPLTKQAKEINPKLKVFASPWSAPGWMKTSGEMRAGSLIPEYYESYAKYFVKFIEEYKKQGIDVYAVTPQNEPLYEPTHYPSMKFLAHEEAKFVSENLKPAFKAASIQTKILGYDHNWDRIDYAFDLFDLAEDSFDGIAWHWYGGKAISQTRVESFFPNKEIHFTEGSGGDWIPGFSKAFENLMRTGIDILRNNSRSMILWNMALDEENGPFVPGFGKSTCRGIAKVYQKENTYKLTQDYFGLAHFSKYVRPGAYRLESDNHQEIKNVVFENQDGTFVLIAFNDSNQNRAVNIDGLLETSFSFNLKAKEAVTIFIEK